MQHEVAYQEAGWSWDNSEGASRTGDRAFAPCQPVDSVDLFFSVTWPFVAIVGFLAVNATLLHWFLIPVYLCGIIVGLDAVRWFRGRMDLFDAKGLIGTLGCHFFVVAPLLVAHYRPGQIGKIYVNDWRPWLGGMACINLVGLLLYQWFQSIGFRRPSRGIPRYWSLAPGRAIVIATVVLLIALSSHLFYLYRLGGLAGFITAKTYGPEGIGVAGMGSFMVLGRSLPILGIILLTLLHLKKSTLTRTSFWAVAGLLFLCLLAQVFVGGLSGSRSSTVWQLFWAAGIIHFFWRRIPLRWVLLSIIPFLMFMYLYSFYKEVGKEALDVFRGRSVESLSAETGRTFPGMLIGDLSRADIQAAQFKFLVEKPWPYRYWWGKTYATCFMARVPRRVWPNRPADNGKVVAGTLMQFGPRSYAPRSLFHVGYRSVRIYGLAGEAMLNFGLIGVPMAFAAWGYVVGRIRRRLQSYSQGDLRLLTAPFLVNVAFMLLIHDLDNVFAVALFYWVIPAITVYLISTRSFLQSWPLEADSASTAPVLG